MRGESSPMAQWEARFPAIISATFYRCIKLKTRYNMILVQIRDWMLLRGPMRPPISCLTSSQIKLAQASLWRLREDWAAASASSPIPTSTESLRLEKTSKIIKSNHQPHHAWSWSQWVAGQEVAMLYWWTPSPLQWWSRTSPSSFLFFFFFFFSWPMGSLWLDMGTRCAQSNGDTAGPLEHFIGKHSLQHVGMVWQCYRCSFLRLILPWQWVWPNWREWLSQTQPFLSGMEKNTEEERRGETHAVSYTACQALRGHPFTAIQWWMEEYLICVSENFLDRRFSVLERIQPPFLPPPSPPRRTRHALLSQSYWPENWGGQQPSEAVNPRCGPALTSGWPQQAGGVWNPSPASAGRAGGFHSGHKEMDLRRQRNAARFSLLPLEEGTDITVYCRFSQDLFMLNKPYLFIFSPLARQRAAYLAWGKSLQPQWQIPRPALPEASFNSGLNLLMRHALRSEGSQREGFGCCWTAETLQQSQHWLQACSP